ncbi:hypothetical protein Z945_1922 [Sulfitobacter noctilucae]|nr:hypothetical protein Z945_1922 [Sulfitobacter noctilucae]
MARPKAKPGPDGWGYKPASRTVKRHIPRKTKQIQRFKI